MILSDMKQIEINHEGIKLKPYRCPAGKLTIGVGRNLDDCGIRPDEAEMMLENDLRKSYQDLLTIFPEFQTYSLNRQHALIDMRFQLGFTGFIQFRQMIKAVKSGDWEEASKQAFDSDYAKEVPARAAWVSANLLEG